MRAFLKRVQSFAGTHDLWRKNQSFIIGVSGGPDSLCLLDVMVRLSRKYGWRLHVAHVNYRLRGRDSLLDEKLIKKQASFYNLPLIVLRPRFKKSGNLEESLRNIRYHFFEKLRKAEKADAIAVAHNQDDQAETFLMRLLRGSGLRGLSAMRPQNGLVIRPLLGTSRHDIEQYLRETALPSREDESNLDPRYLRNRVRHELLPYLEKNYYPTIKETLAKTADLLAGDYEALEKTSGSLATTFGENHVEFSRGQALLLSRALLHRELRRLFRPYFDGKNPPLSLIEETRKLLKSAKSKSQKIAFRGLILRRFGDKVRLLKNPPSPKKS